VTAVQRLSSLTSLAVADAVRSRRPRSFMTARVEPDALAAAIRWLCLTHDVTKRRGSSKRFSLLHGWEAAFPETTGYVIGTLLDYAGRKAEAGLTERAQEMGDWEIEVQGEDGGIMAGVVTELPKRSIVFNTGMVMHGWIDLYEWGRDARYLEAATRAGRFLGRIQDKDGAWRGAHTYAHIAHTYKSRVDWALLRLAQATGDDEFRRTARRDLDWVLTQQQPNGWFESCVFKPGMLPSTHGLAYTMRGLLESYALIGGEAYLEAAETTARALLRIFEQRGMLPGTLDRSWEARARYVCLTGTAQVGGVWLRLYQLTGDRRFREAGVKAVEQAAGKQIRSRWSAIDGSLPGSFPIYGRYAPLQFPNWATKFLADSLMLREDVLAERQPAAAGAAVR
jgi:uncharacterized protein YyaL (SSP411 family)